jgi:antitoxin CptB
MKEMDLLMGGFADCYLASFDAAQLAHFEVLLRQSDIDLYNWRTGKSLPPAELDNDVTRLLLKFEITSVKD